MPLQTIMIRTPAPDADVDPGPRSLVSSVQLHTYSPSLLVIRASVTGRQGITEQLSVTMPAAPYGTAPRQVAALALYLAELRREEREPSGASLRDFLAGGRADLPFASATHEYPHHVLHDRRVTCLLDVLIGERDSTGWPSVSLLVWEREEARHTGYCGFTRVNRYRGARAVLASGRDEVEGERGRLAALAHRRAQSPGAGAVAEIAALAGRVADLCRAACEQANADGQREGAGRAREAMRLPKGTPERQEDVSPRPAAEVVTGVVARPVEAREVEGRGAVARLQIAVDPQGAPRIGGAMPELLICALEGPVAERVRDGLKAGDRVVVKGRRRVRPYRGTDNVPRTAVYLEVEAIGLDLA